MIASSAAICVEPHAPLEIGDVVVAPPRDGEVLVEIVASGLCHTDLTALDGDNPSAVYPLIPGHEGAGRVVEIGPGVHIAGWGKAVLLGVEPIGGEMAFPPVGVRYGKSIQGSYFGGIIRGAAVWAR